MKKSLQTVLFGSGPVAARTLELIAQDFDILLVVTKRNRARFPAPVEVIAEKLGLQVKFADTKSEVSQLVSSSALPKTRCGIVVDYGVMLAQDVIDYFPLGIVNSHFSLLPLLRGADPISFAILEGHAKTGVSLMKIVEKLDEGDLLAVKECVIDDTDTTLSLTEKLVKLSAQMLIEFLPLYVSNEITLTPQSGTATYTRKLTKDDGKLDFTKPAELLSREVRAYAGWPKSYTKLADIDVVITAVSVLESTGNPTGSYQLSTDPKSLIIYCSEGALRIEKLIPAGKKEMTAEAFINGYGGKLAQAA